MSIHLCDGAKVGREDQDDQDDQDDHDLVWIHLCNGAKVLPGQEADRGSGELFKMLRPINVEEKMAEKGGNP